MVSDGVVVGVWGRGGEKREERRLEFELGDDMDANET